MIKILLYLNKKNISPRWPPLRQTFMSSGLLLNNKYKFILNDEEDYDYLLTFADGIKPEIEVKVAKNKRIVVCMENPSIWSPNTEYLNYFGNIITPVKFDNEGDIKNIVTQPGVSWFYGLKFKKDQGLSHVPILNNYLNLNDLAEIKKPNKNKLLSMIVSNKNGTKGHLWRIESALAIKKYFGENIDMFGFGWNPIEDKRDALDSYQYSIVIENEAIDNYWTEKLSDTILGFTIPIYFGASNVQKYFEAEMKNNKYGVTENEIIKIIKENIDVPKKNEDLYSLRHQILYEHNIFYSIANMIEKDRLK
jgi:hypothetical protein